ncbi:Lrp/AsnC family transcriptional regulator [Pseudoxanthomonas sp.]|uniref:Lrp/AsnC family transcriptional regulator n=1 Tax=Pseudoxanthomonas sp. TaxID=1871049 RepID=UPI002609CE83|nr:Lrp/AsnC family transcriptional regulator [Pseudoxanthomonas sp.]WDS34606.1 MAG: Lrp/AsnC family transcriptional regulator [Pseudoxanthomonas sp.]
MALDAFDLKILAALQGSGRMTNQELATRVGMATSPCWRRVRQLEADGVISGYRVTLDRKQLGLGILAYVRVKIDSHSEKEARQFELEVGKLDEVVACYAVAGDSDFLLQVVARDLESYSEFAMSRLRRLPGIKEMETTFVLREIKPLGPLPLQGGR